MLLLNWAVCGKKKSTYIKNQEINSISNDQFKMNKIINKFLFTGDKFKQELSFKQPVFIYSACRPFTKYRKKN